MKKILISLSIIAGIAAIVVSATAAFFSNTKTVTGNAFTAGIIDISVAANGIPWSGEFHYTLKDMKPGQVNYSNFTISNAAGNNPVNVWKKVSNIKTEDNGINEPEDRYYDTHPEELDAWLEKNDIDTVITYDLSVVLKNPAGEPQWNQTLYNENKTIAEIGAIADKGTFLGMIPAGWTMDVTESYHLPSATGNWAQSDKMTFDITITAEQLTGTVILEDKDISNWRVKSETARQGILVYRLKDDRFHYSFSAVGMTASTSYSLIAYHELFSVPAGGPGFPRPVTIIGSATADTSGNIIIPQTIIELGTSLLNSKIWLVKTSDLSGNSLTGWNPSEILFDTGLIDYYNTND